MNGTAICTVSGVSGWPITQSYPKICSDGANGSIISWEDNRNEFDFGDIYAQRILSNGKIPIPPSDGGGGGSGGDGGGGGGGGEAIPGYNMLIILGMFSIMILMTLNNKRKKLAAP